MKKITVPTEEALRQHSNSEHAPLKRVEFSNMKSMKNLYENQQLPGLVSMFVEKEKIKMNSTNNTNYYLNYVVLEELMQKAEGFFVYGSKEERSFMKDQAISELLLEHFTGNEDVLNCVKHLLKDRIVSWSYLRRLLKRVYNRIFLKGLVIKVNV